MKYLGYLVIIAALYAGFRLIHPISIITLALLSTLIFATARRQSTKGQHHTSDNNALMDGVFLFALQLLIMFTVYNLGYFMTTDAGSRFVDFFMGRRG